MGEMPTPDRDYFASRTPWLWHWEEGGGVVAWAEGGTIAFRDELSLVLQRLQREGLPRFGALVFLVAACRDRWDGEALREQLARDWFFHSHIPNDREATYARIRAGLERVHAYRESLKSPERRADLAAFVFANSPRQVAPSQSERLVENFVTGLPAQTLASDSTKRDFESHNEFDADLSALEPGLAAFTVDRFEQWVKTGLENVPTAADVRLPPGEAVRALLREHTDDATLGALWRITSALQTAVRLPRRRSVANPLPEGGVSDLSNRGSFDRLLLSELANDDLTLAIRVAMSEAIYLRREEASQRQASQRLMLVDCGLRLWGVPRLFATAVAMAIASQTDASTPLHVYRPCGKRAEPVDLLSIAGLQSHLAALEPSLHPGAALSNFASLAMSLERSVPRANSATTIGDTSRVAARRRPKGDFVEAILITHADTWRDVEFRERLADLPFETITIVTVTREGALQIWQRTDGLIHLHHESQLDLASLIEDAASVSHSLEVTHEDELPAFFRQTTCPLRFVAHADETNTVLVESFAPVTYTKSGRLLHWNGQKTAREIAHDLPEGSLRWASRMPGPNGLMFVVGGNKGRHHLVTWHVDGEPNEQRDRLTQIALHPRELFFTHAKVEGEHVLLGGPDGVEVCDRRTGASLAYSAGVAPLGMNSDPFVRIVNGSVRKVVVEQRQITWQSLETGVSSSASGTVLAAFSGDEPYTSVAVIYSNGWVLPYERGVASPCPELQSVAPTSLKVRRVSRDRQRVLFEGHEARQSSATRWVLVDLTTGWATFVWRDIGLESDWFRTNRPPPLFKRLRGVGFTTHDRVLMLVNERGRAWPILRTGNHDILRFPKEPVACDFEELRFELWPNRGKWSKLLRIARWPDGSRVVADARGLLHVASSNPSIPEFTLVLNPRELAGWTADGFVFGARRFAEDGRPRISVADAQARYLDPFLRGLR